MTGIFTASVLIALLAAALIFSFAYFETYRHFEKSDKRLRISFQNGFAMPAAALVVVFAVAYLLLRFSLA